MEKTKVVIDDRGRGEVQLFENEIKAGKMNIAVSKGNLTVFHTEVEPSTRGTALPKYYSTSWSATPGRNN
ncbi:hypothetical protein [Hymenobacter sp. YC55]|uniref:hypothetical protein n=1 Tax=Hymenobacter sp. YC55 TaxID=3034019 RepID=UPI0023F9B710|nr:hypothetical protein [Hymenobacter sp. YC55]MDF7814219.1 hypothetical protein [Hymenobacter sp. YC55]